MVNNHISQVNKFSLVRNMSARDTREIGKLMIELQEGNICDDRIYDNPWLKLNELQKMNILIDEAFDNAWRVIQNKDKKMHKKIDINKYLEIDRYVDKYTDIINGKIELLNNIGVILDSAMIEIQSKVDMINDVKQQENIDIETLKVIHKTRNTREIGKLMIELQEGNICDDRIYDDPWLKRNELQKMNILID